MTSSDAYTPATTQDDSLFQGFITLYRTQRAVPAEMPLPDRGTVVGTGWGDAFADHIIIARGLVPDKSLRVMWIQHMAKPLSFAAQDAYNFAEDGTQLTRVYVMLRSQYLAGYAPDQEPPGVATLLASGSDDDEEEIEVPFANLGYCYTGEKVDRIGTDPDSIFVAITRTWVQKTKVRKFYDDDIDSDILETTTIIAKGAGSASSSAGEVTRIDPGDRFIDYQVTQTVVGFSESKQLRSLMADVPYRFPMLMTSAAIVGCAALADSETAAAAYNESFYFSYNLVEPTIGPYEARILRFLVANPDTLRGTYPIQKFVTRREIMATCRAYYIASAKGNTAVAQAEEREVPPSIHGEIEIINADTISIGQSTDTLLATPNFAALTAMAVMNVGYEPKKTRYGLYLIEITQINVTGLYSGVTVPFPPNGDPKGDTGAGVIETGITPPKVKAAAFSADNKTIAGVADKNSEITVKLGKVVYGTAMSDSTTGAFSIAISPVVRDAVDFSVRARRSGVFSTARIVTSYDLAPLKPSVTISPDLGSAYGTTESGATINLYVNLGAQTETLTIPDKVAQLIGLGVYRDRTDIFATHTGEAKLTLIASVLGAESPLVVPFSVTDGDSDNEMAAKAADALNANPVFSQLFLAIGDRGDSGLGDPNNLYIQVRNPTSVHSDLSISIANGSPDPILVEHDSSDYPITGFPGNSDVLTTGAVGMLFLTVTSSLFPSGQRVNLAVPVGKNAEQIATAAVFALQHSVVNNKYTISGWDGVHGTSRDVILKTRDPAPTDGFLNIALYANPFSGATSQPFSADTTTSGVSYTTVANEQGDWFIAFSPALINGDVITVTATDGGGTSEAATAKASATPPSLLTAVFPPGDYNTISGTATPNGAIVIASYRDAEKGRATISGGAFAINFATNYIHGESFEVHAAISGDESVRSASRYATAANLHLEKVSLDPNPAYPGDLNQFVGKAPVDDAGGYATIVSQLETGGPEYTVTPFANGRFSLALPGFNGEVWLVWARYAVGDSDPISEFLPTVSAKPAPIHFHYQGSLAPVPSTTNGLWDPESGYPAASTVRLTANSLVANDALLNILIEVPTASGFVASATNSENTVTGGSGQYQVETATVPLATPSNANARVTIKSSVITGAGGTGLVLTFPVSSGDTGHIIAARAIAKLNATSAVTAGYSAGSTGALNQIAIENPYPPGTGDITISFDGLALPDIVYSPANQAIYDLYPSGYLTGGARPEVPVFLSVKVELPDGRKATNTFTRKLFKPYSLSS